MVDIQETPIPEKQKRNVFIDIRKLLGDINVRVVSGAFQSYDFVTGVSGWRLKADGTLEINGQIFTGNILAGPSSVVANEIAVFDGTTGKIVKSAGKVIYQAKTLFPRLVSGDRERLTNLLNVNTIAYFGLVYTPHDITINRLTIRSGDTATTPGTVDIAIYSEDGQTKILEVTTASIGATFTYYTTTVSPVYLPAGLYYVAIVSKGSAAISYMGWQSAVDDDTYAVASGKVITGSLTVTASTLPTTFDPTALTFAQHRCLVSRLDNI